MNKKVHTIGFNNRLKIFLANAAFQGKTVTDKIKQNRLCCRDTVLSLYDCQPLLSGLDREGSLCISEGALSHKSDRDSTPSSLRV